MDFKLQVSGIQKVNSELLKKNNKIRGGIMREVAKTATNIHKEARNDAATDTGQLRAKIIFTVRDMAATVWSKAKYSIDVEKGQKPGRWPNPYELQGWVKRKLKVPKNKLKGVTYLVGKKIFEQGTDAQPYFEPAVKKHGKKFYNNVKRLIAKAVK